MKGEGLMELYIVKATDEDGTYQYEYGNIIHAKEHYNNEVKAELLQYMGNDQYVTLFCK